MAVSSPSLAEQLAEADPQAREEILAQLSDAACEALLHDWTFWARPEQLPPEDDEWDVFLLLGGRGSGKTRPCAEIIHQWAENPGWYLALVGETSAEVRDVMLEGESGILATQKPDNPCVYEPSKRRVIWPKTGTWATTFSGDSPDQLRGPNCHGAWVDELCKFFYPDDTWNNLEMVLRAGEHPRVVVSTTPRPIPLLKSLIASARTVVRRYSTYANIANLAPTFIRRILERYEGTRLGRQELHAEILEDNPDALWSHSLLDATRVTQPPRVFDAVAIGIDPPGGLVTECGIVASGRSQDGQGYVLADRSTAGRPEQWATAAWAMALWLAETYDVRPWLIAEKNHGGEMVRSTLEVARPKGCSFRVELVTASQGKVARAEPVVMLYEQGRYHHVGTYPALEDEMTQWTPLDPSLPSPNRLDGLVWSAHGLKLVGTTLERAGTWGR